MNLEKVEQRIERARAAAERVRARRQDEVLAAKLPPLEAERLALVEADQREKLAQDLVAKAADVLDGAKDAVADWKAEWLELVGGDDPASPDLKDLEAHILTLNDVYRPVLELEAQLREVAGGRVYNRVWAEHGARDPALGLAFGLELDLGWLDWLNRTASGLIRAGKLHVYKPFKSRTLAVRARH